MPPERPKRPADQHRLEVMISKDTLRQLRMAAAREGVLTPEMVRRILADWLAAHEM